MEKLNILVFFVIWITVHLPNDAVNSYCKQYLLDQKRHAIDSWDVNGLYIPIIRKRVNKTRL